MKMAIQSVVTTNDALYNAWHYAFVLYVYTLMPIYIARQNLKLLLMYVPGQVWGCGLKFDAD